LRQKATSCLSDLFTVASGHVLDSPSFSSNKVYIGSVQYTWNASKHPKKKHNILHVKWQNWW